MDNRDDKGSQPAEEAALGLEYQGGAVTVRFRDREKKRADIVLFVTAATEDGRWFKRHGDTALAHAPSARDSFFALCVEAVEAALPMVPAPPNEDNFEAWESALRGAIEQTVLPLRFEFTITPVVPDGDMDDDELDRLLDDILADE